MYAAAAAAGTGALNYFTRAEICSSVMHKMNFLVGLYFQGMPTTGHSSDSLIPAFLASAHWPIVAEDARPLTNERPRYQEMAGGQDEVSLAEVTFTHSSHRSLLLHDQTSIAMITTAAVVCSKFGQKMIIMINNDGGVRRLFRLPSLDNIGQSHERLSDRI